MTATIGHVVRSDLASRAYGQVAVAQLEALDDAAAPLAKAYATHFRVPGRTCSLLMLETEGDYARFKIQPDEDAVVVKVRPAGQAVAQALAARRDVRGGSREVRAPHVNGVPGHAALAFIDRRRRPLGRSHVGNLAGQRVHAVRIRRELLRVDAVPDLAIARRLEEREVAERYTAASHFSRGKQDSHSAAGFSGRTCSIVAGSVSESQARPET